MFLLGEMPFRWQIRRGETKKGNSFIEEWGIAPLVEQKGPRIAILHTLFAHIQLRNNFDPPPSSLRLC